MAVELNLHRKRAQRLMRILGVEAHYCKPNLTRPAPGHEVYRTCGGLADGVPPSRGRPPPFGVVRDQIRRRLIAEWPGGAVRSCRNGSSLARPKPRSARSSQASAGKPFESRCKTTTSSRGGEKMWWCAGRNRHGVEAERALRERSSNPLGPEFCTGHCEVFSEA